MCLTAGSMPFSCRRSLAATPTLPGQNMRSLPVGQALGSADTLALRNLKNGLSKLRTELKLPATLAQAGVDPRNVWYSMDAIVKSTLADPCCATNPIRVEDSMVRQILEEVTGRV